MNVFTLQHRLGCSLARWYTALVRRSFAACGPGTRIFFPCRVDNASRLELGDKCIIMPHCFLTLPAEWAGRSYAGRLRIGDRTAIGSYTQIAAIREIRIGKAVGIGPGCIITDHIHDYIHVDQPITYGPLSEPEPIVIEDEAFLGAHTIVAPGARIGKHAFIGGNSVVIGEIPPYTLAAGNPARVIKRFDAARGEWVPAREPNPASGHAPSGPSA